MVSGLQWQATRAVSSSEGISASLHTYHNYSFKIQEPVQIVLGPQGRPQQRVNMTIYMTLEISVVSGPQRRATRAVRNGDGGFGAPPTTLVIYVFSDTDPGDRYVSNPETVWQPLVDLRHVNTTLWVLSVLDLAERSCARAII